MADCVHHFIQVTPPVLRDIDHTYKPARGPRTHVPVKCSKWKCKKCRKIEWFPLDAGQYQIYSHYNMIRRIAN